MITNMIFNLNVIFLVILIKNNHGFKSNHKISRSSKSIFSNKKYTESVLPARYTVKNTQLEDSSSKINTPSSSSFLGMEYPMNVVDSSKPFYFPTTTDEEENDAMLSPFPDYVKSTFKILNDKSASDRKQAKIKNEYKDIFTKAISNLQSNTKAIQTNQNTRAVTNEYSRLPVLEKLTALKTESINEEVTESSTTTPQNLKATKENTTEVNSKNSSRNDIESVETEIIIYDDTDNLDADIILLNDNDENNTNDSNEFLVEIFRVLEVIEENLNNSTHVPELAKVKSMV